VLINNAGIMQIDDAAGKIDDQLLTLTVTTNLLGPIRLTSALIEHLKKQPKAAVIYNTSALAFVPLALNRGLFVHEGGPAFVRPFAALQPQGHAETNFRFDRINFLFHEQKYRSQRKVEVR
jgi:NAD(P)-dependent dehydrogenase (short-subunit alcohol dehydrogenase family)